MAGKEMAPLPALTEGFRDRAVRLGEFSNDQCLSDKIDAMTAPFNRQCCSAKPQLPAFADQIPVEGLVRVRNTVTGQRDRCDDIPREFASLHLPRFLLVSQTEIHFRSLVIGLRHRAFLPRRHN